MLTKAKNILCEQLTKNLAEQDFYKNVCTEIIIKNNVVMQLLHPSVIKDKRTGEDVFPEWAQNDIDKEYEPMIALCFSFSMKNDKQQLETFKARSDFGDFREIKDFGSWMYAMFFGTDVKKAAEKALDIAKDIYDADKVRNIKIVTSDIENGIEYAKKTILLPKKEPEPVKIDGIAMRVVEEEPNPTPVPVPEPAKVEPVAEMSDRTYRLTQWILGIVVAVFLVGLLIYVNRKNERHDNQPSYESEEFFESEAVDTVTDVPISEEERERILGKSTQQVAKEEPQVEIIGKWRETNSGKANYIWLLERNKSNNKYQVTISYPGGAEMAYNCIRKKIKRNEYIIHDPDHARNSGTNGLLTLQPGTTIYFISGFDNGANAILLLMPDNITRVYTNDTDSRYYELFANLQSFK